MKTSIVAVALLVSVLPRAAESKTLYVDRATGNDSVTYAANGPSTPWATIGRAAWGNSTRTHVPNEAARPGDIIIVMAGTYDQAASGSSRLDPLYNPANSGTAGNPITFRAQGQVILRSSTYRGPVIGSNSRNYIVWDGFFVDEPNINSTQDTGPVVVWSSTGSVIRNTEIRSKIAAWSDNHNGIRIEQSNGTLIQNNLIYDVGSDGTRGQNDAAIMLYDSNDSVIEGNTMYNCGVGVFVKGNHPGFTQDRTIIRRNLVYGMNTTGIMLLASREGRVYQNVVRDSTWGVTVYSLGGGPSGDIWQNNTVHNSRYGGVQFRGSAPAWSSILFLNNIITGASEAAINGEVFSSPADATFDHNVYFGFQNFANFGGAYRNFNYWRSTWGKDTANPASVNVDPRYVNASAGDFRLASNTTVGSIGVDALDLNNNGSTSDSIRPGAYITGNETIGYGGGGGGGTPPPQSQNPPAPPSNVRIVLP